MSKWKKSSLQGLLIQGTVGDMINVNGGEIRIEVVAIRGRYVRLAFQASREIRIERSCKSLQNGKEPTTI